jgi:general secretion pathway protein I
VRRLLIHRRRGFTLVETLVAFAVLALAMSQLMAALGGGARNESRADFLLRASREGQSQLDAIGIEGPIARGETNGAYDDGLLWNLSVEPYLAVKALVGGGEVASFWLRLTIRRPGAQEGARESLTLTTLKIVATREPPR